MSESTSSGAFESGPFDLWDTCLREAEAIELKYETDTDGKRRALTPREKTANGEWEFSRLPEIYAKVVRTPSFLKWFGDWTSSNNQDTSQVVYGDTREPRPVVHVTKYHIFKNTLEPRPSSGDQRKLWFAESIAAARGHRREGDVYFAFINLRNPLRSQNADEYLENRYDGLISTPDDRLKKTYDYCVRKVDQVMQIPALLM